MSGSLVDIVSAAAARTGLEQLQLQKLSFTETSEKLRENKWCSDRINIQVNTSAQLKSQGTTYHSGKIKCLRHVDYEIGC